MPRCERENSLPADREGGENAVAEVLGAYFRAIGTPPPAPGIERLAFLAVEAAWDGLRERWEAELLDGLRRSSFDSFEISYIEDALEAIRGER